MLDRNPFAACISFVLYEFGFAFGLKPQLVGISVFVAPFEYAEYHWAAIADVGQAKGALDHRVAVGFERPIRFPTEDIGVEHRAGQGIAIQP